MPTSLRACCVQAAFSMFSASRLFSTFVDFWIRLPLNVNVYHQNLLPGFYRRS